MSTIWLFLILLLTWGPSWYAITFQIAEVSPEVSVGIRFLLAGAIFSAYCFFTGERFAFSRAQWLRIVCLALLLFSTNYIIIYHATHSLNSGLVSVIHSTLPIFNIVNAWLLMREKATQKTWIAAAIGLVGITLVFHKEWDVIANLEGELMLGIGLAFLATYIASLGNLAAVKTREAGVSTKSATALGMLMGGGMTLAYATLMGFPIRVPLTLPFLGSLAFLVVMASIVAFFVYFKLIERIGPGRSAYVALVYPLVALYISTVFEGYVIDGTALVGFALIVAGNFLILSQKDRKPEQPQTQQSRPEREPKVWIPAQERLRDY